MSVISDKLRNRVGSLLDVRITEATTPSKDQVDEWMYEGALMLCKILPIGLLGTMMDVETATVTKDWDVGGLDIVKAVSVEKNDAGCTIYPYPELVHIRDNMSSLHTTSNFACAFTGEVGGASIIRFYPETSASATLTFVTSPAPVSKWAKTTAPHLIPPDTWSELIVEYAVMKGKIQDEEEQAATMLYQMWMQSIQAFSGSGVLGTDVE